MDNRGAGNWRTIQAVALIAIGAGLILVKVVMGWPSPGDLKQATSAPSTLVLGRSKLVVPRDAVVGVQVDRVVRDIAWTGSRWDGRVQPERVPASADDLVPYMEGRLVGELMRYARVRVLPLTPAVARRNPEDGLWYASDASGNFRFEIDSSKIDFPSVRHLSTDSLEMPDTHGFNSIAAEAVRRRPFLAVACMDLPSKADAALYLVNQGINAYAPEDRFSDRLVGYRLHRPHSATIIGSAPIRPGRRGTAVIGNQPIEIALNETIVVQWTDKRYPWQYSDTPWRYFSALSQRYFLNLKLVRIQAESGQLERVIDAARARKAMVVAVRVGKATTDAQAEHDANVLAAWLKENPRHRAVLLHSAPYEPGYGLFFRFPNQTTFGDLDPAFR